MQILNLSQAPQYLPEIAQWHHDEWGCYNPGLSLHARVHDMQLHLSNELMPSTYVAIEGQMVVGSAALISESDMQTHPEWSPWLASVFVSPDWRRKGIATALIRHILEQAGQHHVKNIYLFTPDQAALYQKLGWRIMHKEEYMGHDVTIMTIDL